VGRRKPSFGASRDLRRLVAVGLTVVLAFVLTSVATPTAVAGKGASSGQAAKVSHGEAGTSGPALAVDPSWVNLALGKPVSASNEYPGNPASLAVDGDWLTYWNSGDYPPQWIEVDLGLVRTVGEIDLGVTQLPDSFTVHNVYGRANTSQPWTVLHSFAGYTIDQQLLHYVLSTPENLRYIRIETTRSLSWVGWREIEVWGPPPPTLYDFVVPPRRPVAGRPFTGVMVVNADPQATTIARVLCDAGIAKQRLRGREQRFFSSVYNKVTAIACTWRIPANAGGKRLRLWKYPFGPRVGVFTDLGLVADSAPFSWVVKR
jgi:hypothetical protein